jgi:hypothetical protein
MLASLVQLDPGSDDALEIARLGLLEPVSARFQQQQAKVIAAWSAILAAYACKGYVQTSSSRLDRSEVLADARLWLIQQLREFRPDASGGTAGAFVRSRQQWFRSQVRREAVPSRSQGRFQALAVAGKAREGFIAEHRREPSSEELRALVTLVLEQQTRERILNRTPDIDEESVLVEVRRRMVKDGLTAALESLDDIRVQAMPEQRLQLQEDSDDSAAPGVPLPSVPGPEVEVRDEEDAYERLLRVALGDAQWARSAFSMRAGDAPSGADGEGGASTLKDLAAEASCSVAELREVLAAARSRVSAPHAQWAHLAADVRIVEGTQSL